jgi:hypothetical protein
MNNRYSLLLLFSILWWFRSVILSSNLRMEVFQCLDVYIMEGVGEPVKQPPPYPKGITTCFLMVVKRKIGNFSLHHHQKTCERGFFLQEKNPGWLM